MIKNYILEIPITLKEDNSESWEMTITKKGLEISHSMEEYGSSFVIIPWRSLRAALRRKEKKA